MHVADIETAGDPEIVRRPGEVQARGNCAVNAGVLAADERGDFAETGVVHAQVHIDAADVAIPAAAQLERAETLGGPVTARGARGTGDLPIAGDGRREIEIGFGQVE